MSLTRLFLLLILSASASLACDIDPVLQRSEKLVEQGRHFQAIAWLEQNSQCQHPRIELERGQLYYLIGQTDEAIRIWQATLRNNDLPDSVASHVKLRIVQATLSPPKRISGRLKLSTAHEFHSENGQETTLGLTTLGQWRLAPVNLLGYRATPALSAQISTLQQVTWSPIDYSPLFYLTTGMSLSTQPLQVALHTKAYAVNREWVPAIEGQIDQTTGALSLRSELEYRPTLNLWRWRESLTWQGDRIRHRLSNTLTHEAEQWRWETLSASTRVNWPIRPQLTLSWNPADARTELEGDIRWPLGDHVWLTTTAGTTLSQPTENWAKLSLTWQRP
ncbi:tetratricopeptide repeat protein [Reinekea blandensis]|uniref:Tetratricopeptide repeat protein n=1 Tax=Reinekea blandensis MED297 TaxID=314283 RepID=A4B9H1_9GAMM|nr:hypothetical protein [Reinekea blandensis]EAR11272.1 hypothetical protein MED297_20332 [Reinekea sp. MED297] [Reinekea blandensis MED297]